MSNVSNHPKVLATSKTSTKTAPPKAPAPKAKPTTDWVYKTGGATHYPHLAYEGAHLSKWGHKALHTAEHALAHGPKLVRPLGTVVRGLPIVAAALGPAIAYYDLKTLVKMSKDPQASKGDKIGQALMATGSTTAAVLGIAGLAVAATAGLAVAGPVLAASAVVGLVGWGIGKAVQSIW
jgi:hypothetical protein